MGGGQEVQAQLSLRTLPGPKFWDRGCKQVAHWQSQPTNGLYLAGALCICVHVNEEYLVQDLAHSKCSINAGF